MPAAYNLEEALGFENPPKEVSWNARDVLLYAVGVGAKASDLQLVFEDRESSVQINPHATAILVALGDPNFSPMPTYPTVLQFKGTEQSIVDFRKLLGRRAAPGLPKLDPDRVVHGSQFIEVLRPIPKDSGTGWKLTTRIVGVHENKSGIIIDTEQLLLDRNGIAFTRLVGSSFYVGAGNKGKFSKSIAIAPVAKPPPTGRPADFSYTEKTLEEQAILYRLSGDYNHLHIEPTIGKRAGFGGVILHGLASFGFASRAVTRLAGGDPASLRSIGARFSSPVKPGDVLETKVWVMDRSHDNIELSFTTVNLSSGKVCLSNGIAFIGSKHGSKL